MNGRFAGKKAIIVSNLDKGSATKKFPHALVAGIERAPLKVTKRMGKKRLAKRSKVKPFIKYVNFNHLLPTRYTISSFNLADIKADAIKDKEQKIAVKKSVKKEFEKQYLLGAKATDGVNASFFFKKLRF